MIRVQDLDSVLYKFTELGSVIRLMSDSNSVMFDKTFESLKAGMKVSVEIMAPVKSLKEMTTSAQANTEVANKISEALNKFIGETGHAFDGLSGMSVNFDKEFNKVDERMKLILSECMQAEAEIKSEMNKKKKKKSIFSKEWEGVKGKAAGALHALHLPGPGTLAAGLIGIMAYGVKERARIAQEAGEVSNIMVTTFDSGVKGMVAKGTSAISSLQEGLQKFVGIAKGEVQNVIKTFADGGVSIEEMLTKVDSKMGLVGKNFTTYTLALDKAFELPGGESARRMLSMMSDYNMSLEESRTSLTNLMLVGKESGIGTMQFLKNIEGAAAELHKFGFNINEVADLAIFMQEKFEDIGVPRQFAGKQAAMGIQQIASGIVNMSEDWKLMFAEKLGYGQGVDAINKFSNRLDRLVKDKDKDGLKEIMGMAYSIAMAATDGDEARARNMIQQGMGWGLQGADAVMRFGKAMKEGKTAEASEATKEGMKIITDSYKTEGEKMNKLQEDFNMWMKGLSNVGQYLLTLAAQLFATLIATLKSIPTLIVNKFKGEAGAKANDDLLARIGSFMDSRGRDIKAAETGLDQMKAAAKKAGVDILGKSLDAVKTAFSFDASSGVPSSDSGAIESSTPVIQMVPIAIDSGGSGEYKIPMTGVPSSTKRGDEKSWADIPWVGGALAIVSNGVNQSGDIELTLTGNCPRCGLSFGKSGAMTHNVQGEGKYSGEDVYALASMNRSETGGDTGTKGTLASYAAINRARNAGKSIYDVITGGHGYGKQGADRPFGTSKEPTQKDLDFARKVLRGAQGQGGGVKDPTGGKITAFYDTTTGEGTGSKHAALPEFTKNMTNLVNLPGVKGETWRGYGRGGKKASDADILDAKAKAAYEKTHGSGSRVADKGGKSKGKKS